VFGLARSVFSLAVIVVAPVLIVTRAPLNFLSQLTKAASKPGSAPALAAFADPATGLLIAVVATIVGTVLVGWMTKIFIREIEDRLPSTSGDQGHAYSIAAGAVTGVLYAASVMVGFLCLLVPGVVLLVRGAVCIPVAVAERRGPIAAMRRSWELTHGRHWPIQGVILILLLIMAVVVVIAVPITLAVPFGTSILGRSVAITFANVVGWPTTIGTISALYVRLSVDEELGAFPQPRMDRGSPARMAKAGPGRRRFVVFAAAALGLFAATWYGFGMVAQSRSANDAEQEAERIASSVPHEQAPEPPPPPPITQVEATRARAVSRVVGSVVDVSGAPVSGAMVEVIQEGDWVPGHLGPRKKGKTKDDGSFRIRAVPLGTYAVRVANPGKHHAGFAARAVRGIVVGPDGSAHVTLTLEPGTRIELPYEGPGQVLHWTRYAIQDDLNPLVNGFGIRRINPGRRPEALSFVALPGTVRLSFDPCFHPQAEVHTIEVHPDGAYTGPKALPREPMVDTSVRVVRADGEPVGRYDVSLVSACVPPNSDSSMVPDWSLTYRTTRPIRKTEDGLYTMHTARGVVWRAIVMAEGSPIAESEPFTSGADQPPPEVVLQPANPATITFRVVGLPAHVASRVTPGHFQVWYESPSGILTKSSERWPIELGANDVMTFASLPAGEKIHVAFALRLVDVGYYLARAAIEIEDGAHFDLRPYQINTRHEPHLWNGRWSDFGLTNRGWWRMPVDPSRWLTTY
jgi:hypothetical protein